MFKAGLAVVLLSGMSASAFAQAHAPVIDMHLHAYSEEWRGRPPNPATGTPAPASADEHMRQTLEAMNRYNIVVGIVSGPLEAVAAWRAASPDRIMGSPLFGRPGVDNNGNALPSLGSLEAMYRSGSLQAMAEVTAQYEGLSPSDPALEPYFALAEKLDIPVGIHTGTSFPGTPYAGSPKFRVALGNPLLLEDLLVRHPKLRVYIMHGGAPWTRETSALLHMYPQVYMDIAVINWIGGSPGIPRFHEFLRQMVADGFGERIMFGTDQMRWPDAIGLAIAAVESADFLSEKQKRDILYNNAARFLQLSEKQIAQHHDRPATDSSAPASPGPTDEAEIVRILTEVGRSKHTSPDFDWENAFGVRRRGLAEVVAFLEERVYPTMSQAQDTTIEIRVNFVTADVAVADQYWRLTGQTDGPNGPRMADRQGRDTYVFRKENGRWVLVVSRIADLRKQLSEA